MISWNGVRVPGYNEDPGHAHAVYGDFYKKYLATGGVKVLGYISMDQVIGQPDGGAQRRSLLSSGSRTAASSSRRRRSPLPPQRLGQRSHLL